MTCQSRTKKLSKWDAWATSISHTTSLAGRTWDLQPLFHSHSEQMPQQIRVIQSWLRVKAVQDVRKVNCSPSPIRLLLIFRVDRPPPLYTKKRRAKESLANVIYGGCEHRRCMWKLFGHVEKFLYPSCLPWGTQRASPAQGAAGKKKKLFAWPKLGFNPSSSLLFINIASCDGWRGIPRFS